MTHTRYRWLQIAITIGLAGYFFWLITSGRLLWYINIRFVLLSFLGMILLFALAGNALDVLRKNRRSVDRHENHLHHEHTHSAASLLWLALPLALGLFIPARQLGADAAAYKGVTLAGPLITGSSQPGQLSEAPDQFNVLDWIRLFNYETDLTPFLGKAANVTGFVYEDLRLPDGHFLVARFTVSCCVADAFAIGMAVKWHEALPVNSWVNVRGPVDVLFIDGHRVPLILAESIEPTEPPDQPYLFP
jgi:putative membrane protein